MSCSAPRRRSVITVVSDSVTLPNIAKCPLLIPVPPLSFISVLRSVEVTSALFLYSFLSGAQRWGAVKHRPVSLQERSAPCYAELFPFGPCPHRELPLVSDCARSRPEASPGSWTADLLNRGEVVCEMNQSAAETVDRSNRELRLIFIQYSRRHLRVNNIIFGGYL